MVVAGPTAKARAAKDPLKECQLVASTTPYHPQGDGHMEHTNHTVERMPRDYVDANQMDWDLWCTPVEHAINDSRSAVTGFTPFELCCGHAPASQLDFFVEAALASRDMVWVDATHLTQPGDRGLHKKPLKKRLGPMEVLEAFHTDQQMELAPGDRGAPAAYRLKIPQRWKVHDVFTVDKLTPVESGQDKFVDRSAKIPPPPVDVSGRKEMAMECIDRSRTRRRSGRTWTEDMVKWVGMPRSENEWKTHEDLRFDGVGRKYNPNRALQAGVREGRSQET
ncbi:hypothetical protein CYMTET_12063 [Cymbomonas tetramitiformis]|uniref:Chromo domain-containing protein n=1 Tax=Cymbomonas tetramitiformis TaxID=36881 RepID=A0AAE0LC79_9CHLO|nr:hypothetical protein CYMTET_12063 [Cymbomonas tetramitiformis]